MPEKRPSVAFAPKPEIVRPITFAPIRKAFKPQVKVQALKDLNGWANRERRVKWHISKGSVGCIDADKAREFQVKGYVRIIEGEVEPVSEDEAAEMLATVKTITLGVG